MTIPVTLGRLLLVAAVVCFIVALLLAVGAFTGSSEKAWEIGGFLALTLGFLL